MKNEQDGRALELVFQTLAYAQRLVDMASWHAGHTTGASKEHAQLIREIDGLSDKVLKAMSRASSMRDRADGY